MSPSTSTLSNPLLGLKLTKSMKRNVLIIKRGPKTKTKSNKPKISVKIDVFHNVTGPFPGPLALQPPWWWGLRRWICSLA